ncbi:PhzF family phenazine biosynthesis protein [Lacihabitans sp. CCS-44]|uniref:PhzF family phenazine biosynthesis protein n=1 Tax=Lacihabitans sp. CCS-44 TaxID=2487331 RepID=UPI00286E0DDC|nr:PhzF family phenazine biosynthesis protein [Lacihabitans sp. CCS-44]
MVPLDFWLSETIMQQIASQNNLSETAFFVKTSEDFHIRWFTPTVEVNLCGHATLASAYVIFEILGFQGDIITFESKSGPLYVSTNGQEIFLNFPVVVAEELKILTGIEEAMNAIPIQIYEVGDDVLLIFENETTVANLNPDFGLLSKINARGVIASSKSETYDFVCRFFAPKVGVNEDPVTGSAFTKLIPYWSAILEKTKMNACQISQRRGDVRCELLGDRVLIGGKANLYLQGEISF